MKQNPSEKSLLKCGSFTSLQSDKAFISNTKTNSFMNNEDSNTIVLVEERVKLLKNSQINQIYKSLKEICKQINEFKSYYVLSIQKQKRIEDNHRKNRK